MLRMFLMISVSALTIVLLGCATGGGLRTVETRPDEVAGTYTLLLYGGRHANDIETIAFLDREDDRTAFTIKAPDFDYKVVKGLKGPDALARAAEHVKFHHAYRYNRISRILDPSGAVLGYEVRPYYAAFEFNRSDVMSVFYGFREGSVVISIRLYPDVERALQGERDAPFLFRRDK